METITIQIKNYEAYEFLKILERLQIIKIIEQDASKPYKLSEKYKSKLSDIEVLDLQNQLIELRKEWESRNI